MQVAQFAQGAEENYSPHVSTKTMHTYVSENKKNVLPSGFHLEGCAAG